MKKKILKVTRKNLRLLFSDCEACVLHKKRKNVVLGKGPIDAEIFLIGEAPGKNEDMKGIPFIGKDGQKLDIYFDGEDFDTEDFYITNSCCCRPPNNRMPKVTEVKACFDRLRMELEMVNPDWVIFVGMRAATIIQLGIYYKTIFESYETHFINHPGSVRHDPNKQKQIKEQIKDFAEKYKTWKRRRRKK